MDSVSIRVPATCANLGPGYDCLGVAVQLFNRVTVRRGASEAKPHSMAADAGSLFFKTADKKPFEFSWNICGDIPQSRGLGSSVTVRLGILHGLNELSGRPLEREEIFHLCSQLEGHPDNAAPAEFGGFTVAGEDSCLAFPIDERLKFVLLIPDFEISTPEARKVLPPDLEHDLAVTSAGNAARISRRNSRYTRSNFGTSTPFWPPNSCQVSLTPIRIDRRLGFKLIASLLIRA